MGGEFPHDWLGVENEGDPVQEGEKEEERVVAKRMKAEKKAEAERLLLGRTILEKGGAPITRLDSTLGADAQEVREAERVAYRLRKKEERAALAAVEEKRQKELERQEELDMHAEIDAQQQEIKEGLVRARERKREAEGRALEAQKREEKRREQEKARGFDPALGVGNLNKRVEIVGLQGVMSVLNGRRGRVVSIKGPHCVIELDTGRRFSTFLKNCIEAPLLLADV
jgi:hypothetical protein